MICSRDLPRISSIRREEELERLQEEKDKVQEKQRAKEEAAETARRKAAAEEEARNRPKEKTPEEIEMENQKIVENVEVCFAICGTALSDLNRTSELF